MAVTAEILPLLTDPDAIGVHLERRHPDCVAGPVAEVHDQEHAAPAGTEPDHVHEPDLPPPPTETELDAFVDGLDGATQWPEPPPQPGVDVPYGMRLILAEDLHAGDQIHGTRTVVEVVEVSRPVVPVVLRTTSGAKYPDLLALDQHVLASRPTGWADPADAGPVAEMVEEPCPDCGNDPADGDLHRDSCPRVNTTGQFGPPWKPKPWGLLPEPAPAAPTVDELPVWEGGGPSRGEILAGIRRPHHDTETGETDG